MARPGSSNFESRLVPRFDPKVRVFLVRKTISWELGLFNVGQPFAVEGMEKFGFTERRNKLLYDRKYFKLYPEGTDTVKLIEESKKIVAGLVEVKRKQDEAEAPKKPLQKGS